ncbi:hypothetical protein XENTR_v10002445 [Xenopus tropicalis]|nr:hypothetical protein XENTR_v10002445 [Xenopus tropicalis]
MYLRKALIAGGSAAAAAAAILGAAAVGKSKGGPDLDILSVVPAATGQWDRNWDRREPISMVNLSKINGETGEEELQLHLNKHKPKATRHIFLIRHSQYKLDGKTDFDRVLTPLGREQADLTGKRLSSLGFKYNHIVYSTMTRAKETTEIISKYLPDVKKSSSDLLREGAPIRPEPQVCHWKPDFVVGNSDALNVMEGLLRRVN